MNVEFVGAVPEVWPYLAGADVFALASKSEAFGIAIVEAMAAGLPVVAPAVGGIPELVIPGVNGELFPPATPMRSPPACSPCSPPSGGRDGSSAPGRPRTRTGWSAR